MTSDYLVLVVCVLLFSPGLAAGQVVFTNGDRLTGKVLQSDGKIVTLETGVAGLVKVPWSAVSEWQTEQTYVLTMQDGRAVAGVPQVSGGVMVVRTASGEEIPVEVNDIRALRTEAAQQTYTEERQRVEHPGWGDFWQGTMDAGLSTTRGNSETLTVSTGVSVARTTTSDKLSTYLTLLFAENSTTGVTLRTANAVRGGVRYDRNFYRRFFSFGFTDLEADEFKDLDLRTVFGGGLGWRIRQTPKFSLSLFGGSSFNREEFSTGETRRSGEGLLGQELTFRLSDRVEWIERGTAFANLSDRGEYRLTLDSSLITRISNRFSWHITASDRFLSNPVLGAQKNDFLLTTGVRMTFGKKPPAEFETRTPEVSQP